MSDATIRALLKASLDSVTDVGKTHDYAQWAVVLTDFMSKFKTTIGGTKQVRGWQIFSRGYTSEKLTFGGFRRTYEFVINGHLGVNNDDETEKTFATLAETIAAQIDADLFTTDGNKYPRSEKPADVQLGHRIFGSEFCHEALIIVLVHDLASQ
jgi:hypothetical protein